mmetsp:Transcript_34749/g.62556  ORF Transcript_34749/g.62556 Transcript_34749/m.62556 type:complete len:113 (+) Transcript_34749:1858-2196(+)
MDAEGKEGDVKHEDSEAAEGESHDGTSAEGGVETESPSVLLGIDSGPNVRVRGYLHAEVTRKDGSTSPQNKRQGRERPTRKVPSGTPRYQNENNTTKKKDEPGTNCIFGAEE